MPKKNPLTRKENILDFSHKNESSEICACILREVITKSIASTAHAEVSLPVSSITPAGEQNQAWPTTTTGHTFVPEGTTSVVLFDKDNAVGTVASYIRFEHENPTKVHFKEVLEELDSQRLKPRYASQKELNTVEEIAQIEENVRTNDTLAQLRTDSDSEDSDSYSSVDAQRFYTDDDEYLYACRPIYSNKPLMNNRGLDSLSHDSLIALLDFDMGDDDSSTKSACASSHR